MHPLSGTNVIVLDLETQQSAKDCRTCLLSQELCNGYDMPHRAAVLHQYAPIGWNNHALLGLSIGCYWDYHEERFHWFDECTLHATMHDLLERKPLIVSFNGVLFDGPLMQAVSRWQMSMLNPWKTLWEDSYDILREIWRIDPESRCEHGLNSLGGISKANGLGDTEMDGALAPQLWKQGRFAEVIASNVSDVLKTKRLFELICQHGALLRGDEKPIALPQPRMTHPLGVGNPMGFEKAASFRWQ